MNKDNMKKNAVGFWDRHPLLERYFKWALVAFIAVSLYVSNSSEINAKAQAVFGWSLFSLVGLIKFILKILPFVALIYFTPLLIKSIIKEAVIDLLKSEDGRQQLKQVMKEALRENERDI